MPYVPVGNDFIRYVPGADKVNNGYVEFPIMITVSVGNGGDLVCQCIDDMGRPYGKILLIGGVDASRVTRVGLQDGKFNEVPKKIMDFVNLRYLNFGKNKISKFPQFVVSFRHLEWINFSETEITDVAGGLSGSEKLDIVIAPDNLREFNVHPSVRTKVWVHFDGHAVPFQDWLEHAREFFPAYSPWNVVTIGLNKTGGIVVTRVGECDNKFIPRSFVPDEYSILDTVLDVTLEDNMFTEIPEIVKKMKNIHKLNVGNNKIYEFPAFTRSFKYLKRN